jgi:Protein of unknown function (DUF3592)
MPLPAIAILVIFTFMLALVGYFLIRTGLSEIATLRRVRARLLTVEGVVTTIDSQRQSPASDADSKYYTILHFPVIHFHTQAGEKKSFRSEVGDVEKRRKSGHGFSWLFRRKYTVEAEQKRFHPGQAVPVLYDPQGEVPPRIKGWAGLWGAGSSMIAGGSAFVLGAVGMWLVFGGRVWAAVSPWIEQLIENYL